MVFQLTALLDLLLVVLFAQYMETQEQAQRAIRYQQLLRQRAVTEMKQTEQLKTTVLSDHSKLTQQIEQLTTERNTLRTALAQAGTTNPAIAHQQATTQMVEIGSILSERLQIPAGSLEPYLLSATPAERERLLDTLRGLKPGEPATIVQFLQSAEEFRKLSSLWEIHVYDDNTVRIRIDGKTPVGNFRPSSAAEMANKMIEAARAVGEPRSLVVVLMTWGNAELRIYGTLVPEGVEDAITQLRPAWGGLKRIELAKLGYTPQAP